MKAYRLLASICLMLLLIACKTSNGTSEKGKTEMATTKLSKDCIGDMIVITLKGQVKHDMIVSAFGKKYGLKWFSRSDEPGNVQIYHFSPDLVSLEELIEIMKKEQFSSDARCITKQEYQDIL